MNRGQAGAGRLRLSEDQLQRAEQAFATPMRILGYEERSSLAVSSEAAVS